MGIVSSDGNNIHFEGEFGETDLQVAIAAIHNTLKSDQYRSIALDFAHVTKVMAPNIIPLCAHVRQLLHRGFDTFLTLPTEVKLARLFKNTGWAHLIDPIQFPEVAPARGNHSPALIYNTPDEQYAAVSRTIDIILGSSKGLNRGNLSALEWAINEITDNVLNHADSEIGGILQVTTRRDGTVVEVVVCDVGSGIPRTLRSAHREISSDLDALEHAIQEGVTRNSQTNQGNGLFGSSRIAELSGGQFRIHSGYATLKLDKSKGLHIRKNTVPFKGTLIACSINCEDSKILEQALYFRGKKYTPSYTYYDRIDDEETIDFVMRNETFSYGNRENAKPIRNRIYNILKNTNALVRVDMQDVEIVSSSFADEVFGKLSSEIGHDNFSRRVRIVQSNSTVAGLIARAIEQRKALDSNEAQASS
ncbi:STAS-like domain-containing protein [Ciceribacter ferrooxidans]|uniref:DUF4325 domain-containing protein n=1 Tax=Ciceribacter ferrooxidans TaxID=2509717 RepID=A0A4Q2SZ28_9HYPH|nr:STAS-like domain-containing protein [Ciceribacter ferrooxidans]RYC09874.1 DUF4325 domain-containing protein [Ciceribacter ferrooxidans]